MAVPQEIDMAVSAACKGGSDMSAATQRPGARRSNPFAEGLALFAGILMIVNAIFYVLQGIAALVNDEFFVRTANYTFDVDLTLFGWMHIFGGVILGIIGFGVVTGKLWARIAGVVIVILVMVDNFLFIPYYPLWSLLLLAIDALILWALITAPTTD
jgi:hypothetical protein